MSLGLHSTLFIIPVPHFPNASHLPRWGWTFAVLPALIPPRIPVSAGAGTVLSDSLNIKRKLKIRKHLTCPLENALLTDSSPLAHPIHVRRIAGDEMDQFERFRFDTTNGLTVPFDFGQGVEATKDHRPKTVLIQVAEV